MKVKEWKYNDMMKKVTAYGSIWEQLDVERNDDELRMVKVENGFVTFTCRTEIEKETEKAVYVSFAQGAWHEWMPKSVIA